MSSTQMDPTYHLCVYYAQCRLASPTYYVYLPEKPTWYAKSRGDYFKAAIPMMPEENKAIASFSHTTRVFNGGIKNFKVFGQKSISSK